MPDNNCDGTDYNKQPSDKYVAALYKRAYKLFHRALHKYTGTVHHHHRADDIIVCTDYCTRDKYIVLSVYYAGDFHDRSYGPADHDHAT